MSTAMRDVVRHPGLVALVLPLMVAELIGGIWVFVGWAIGWLSAVVYLAVVQDDESTA